MRVDRSGVSVRLPIAASAPPAIPVVAAPAEKEDNQENDQYEFHNFLSNFATLIGLLYIRSAQELNNLRIVIIYILCISFCDCPVGSAQGNLRSDLIGAHPISRAKRFACARGRGRCPDRHAAWRTAHGHDGARGLRNSGHRGRGGDRRQLLRPGPDDRGCRAAKLSQSWSNMILSRSALRTESGVIVPGPRYSHDVFMRVLKVSSFPPIALFVLSTEGCSQLFIGC